jgi:hypothetical protein
MRRDGARGTADAQDAGDRYVALPVWCKSCRHQADADLQTLVASVRVDVPLIQRRFRCGNRGSRLTDSVVTAKAAP